MNHLTFLTSDEKTVQNFENKKSSFQQEQIIQQNVNTESFKLNEEKVNIDHDGIKVEYSKEVADQESKSLDVPVKKSLLDQYPALRFKTQVDISQTKENVLHITEQKENKKANKNNIMHENKIEKETVFDQQSQNHEKSQQINNKNSLPRNKSPQLRNLREVTPPNKPQLAAKRNSSEQTAAVRRSSPSPTRWRQENPAKISSNQTHNLSNRSRAISSQSHDHFTQSNDHFNQSRSLSNQSRDFSNRSYRREESPSPPRRPALPFDDFSPPARPAPPVQETSAPRRPNLPAEEMLPVLPAKSKKVEPYYAVPVSPPRPVTPPNQSAKVEHR